MAQTTGKRLQEARLIRGLSLEDVQHLTRIRLPQLGGMENDDPSVFASPSYARCFYALYGRFLDLDLAEFLKTMEPGGIKPVRHHQYLRPSTDRVLHGRRARAKHSQAPSRAGRVALFGAALVLVVGATAWFSHLYWRRNALGQENTAPAPGAAAANLPLLAGTASTSAPSPLVAAHPETNRADAPSAEPSTQVDVRSTPPPVLKALPVEDAANNRAGPNAPDSKIRQSVPEIRRPAPFTR